MTTSTAPITLPGRHRTDAPTWPLHRAIAVLGYWAALAVWTVRTFPVEHGRHHTAAVVAVLAFILSALAAAVLP